MKIECQQQIEKAFGKQLDTVDNTMRKVYEEGYYHTAFEFQKGLGIGWNFHHLDTKEIDKVIHKPWAQDGKDFSERIWTNKNQLVQQCDTTLTQCIIRGMDPQKAIQVFSSKLKTSRYSAGRLVMTESAAFNSLAQKDCFKELGVEQYEILATLDSHTSEICRNMDGNHFKVSEYQVGITAPPFHPWCRSTTIPFFDDEFTLSETRAYRDANGKTSQIRSNLDYNKWKEIFVDNNHDLTDAEIRAKNDYIGTASYLINEKLRSTSPINEDDKILINNLDNFLSKQPDYNGNLVRDLKFVFGDPQRLLKNFMIDLK